jgi:lysophospholipase L1-like esterase
VLAQHAYSQQVTYKSTEHYKNKVAEFNDMRDVDSTDIVMLGNSLTEYAGEWNILMKAKHIRNRGIAGDDAMGIYHRLNQILVGKPKAIFLMVGINDIANGLSAKQVSALVEMIIRKIRNDSPKTRLYVQSILPINDTFEVWTNLEDKAAVVPATNHLIRAYCVKHGVAYVNLYPKFLRHGTNTMRTELTQDGLHLTPEGYKIWAFMLKKYIDTLK